MRRKVAVGAFVLALGLGAGIGPANAAPNPAKEACKNGGWTTMTRDDGTPFKNQGACVSHGAKGGTYGDGEPVGTAT